MKYITTGNAARLCGVGINTIKRWIQKGELQCVKTPGGHWRIAEDEFQRFLQQLQSNEIISTKPIYKVLLIEDDQSMCALIEAAFDLAHFENQFESVHDGYAGLMKIGAMQPDLIILDIMLPEINGLELIHRIRTFGGCQSIRIMVITGAGDRRLVKKGLDKAQPDALFLKPFSIEQLVEQASLLLQGEQSTEEKRKELIHER